MYIIRLDDASEHMKLGNWLKMKELLDKYEIKPIFGIIPMNMDPELIKYESIDDFWYLVKQWCEEGWIPALHGYNHVFETIDSGINPVNKKSEFAGVSLAKQREKIKKGYAVLREHNIRPDIFFAPAHTYDQNTLYALQSETDIRIISDTIARDIYYVEPFYFIPQQSGRVRELPFKTVTFCYHPNTMTEKDFENLDIFIKKNRKKFIKIDLKSLRKRHKGIFDRIIEIVYFSRHTARCMMRKKGNI